MSDNEIEDVSFLPGESLHRKARYEPNILQKVRLLVCNKARLTVMAVIAGVFLLVIILVAVITKSQCDCSQESPTVLESPKIDQKCVATNGKKFPYQNILLPKAIVPSTYQIFMHPNISESVFRGEVNIICSVVEVTDFIVFHIKDLNITGLNVTDLKSGTQIPVTEQLEYKTNEQVYVRLGTSLDVAKNSTQLTVGFVGNLTEKLAGFYKSMYKTKAGEKRYIATTHFEPTDARAAFPCFDEPALKANFQLTMVREKNFISLFNMPLSKTVPFDEGKNLVKDIFQSSVPMSTYLVAFVVCDYATLTNHTKRNTEVGVYAPEELISTAKFALDSAVQVLEYYEDYFGIEYPLPKQDLIAIPDFAAGAMENWGLITYRMTAILYDPAVSSARNQQWVAVVVAHELAHQWFGNLVTMAWWDDLWLNEGFASYVEYIGSGIVKPDWQMNDQFVIDDLLYAMNLDSLSNSHPISVPVHNPNQINELFDRISYSKGCSIIRMLKNYLGEDIFKAGLRIYLNKYKYSNAATKDLWNSFSGAVQAKHAGSQSSTNVSKLMDTWTQQMGYPVITLQREGGQVTASQCRFLLYANSNISSEFTSPYGYKWQIPFIYRVNADKPEKRKMLMTKDVETFTIPQHSNWVKGNAGMFGFYRVNYDQDNWQALIQQLNTDHTVFSTSERAGLIDDAFMLFRAGLLPNQSIALDLSLYMVHERDYLPWRQFLDNLAYIESRIETKPVYTDYKRYLLKLMKNVLNATNWEDTGKPLEKYLRSTILGKAVELGHVGSINNGQKLFRLWQSNHSSISPNLKTVIYDAGIKYGSEEDWEMMWDAYLKETDASEKRKLIHALSTTRDSNLLVRFLNYGLNESTVRSQDTSTVVSSVTNNPGGQVLAWRFFQQHWDTFHKRYAGLSFILSGLIKSTAGRFDTEFDYNEVKNFFATRDAGSGKRAVQQVLETIQMNIDWLKSHEHDVTVWLKNH